MEFQTARADLETLYTNCLEDGTKVVWCHPQGGAWVPQIVGEDHFAILDENGAIEKVFAVVNGLLCVYTE